MPNPTRRISILSPAARWPARLLASSVLALTLALVPQHTALAQQGIVTGRVIDAEIAEPLSGVTVEVVTGSGRVIASASTGADGEFRLENIPQGRYSLLFTAFGYETQRLDGIDARTAAVAVGSVELVSQALRLNPLVVTASRDVEKALDAPASVYSVDSKEIEERPATTSVDHIRNAPAVDVITSGLARHSVALRGFNDTWNRTLLVLTDNRLSSMPSLRVNAFNAIPTADEDIGRIELVLGPGSALYGPNTANGVLHMITRSPLEHQGTTASLIGGSRELFQGSVRHAGLIGENVGYKISGMYFRGDEWKYADSVEVANRQAAIDAGADPDTLLIGLRDFDAGRFSGDARLDFRLDDHSTLILSGGYNRITSSIEQGTGTTVQAQDNVYTYIQARFHRDQLFAQAYVNWGDAGDSYQLRSGARLVDNSVVYAGQIQHATDLGRRQRFVYGADLCRTVPRTGGTINGLNEEDDETTEIGGYLQSESRLSPRFDIVAAARLDYHDVMDEVVFSPRAALVFKPADGHNLRLTYNRAFNQPATVYLFADLVSSPTLGGLPYAIRASGAPSSGFTFRRDCSSPVVDEGLCMRSPFTPEAMGGPSQLLPLDATLFWDAAVQILAAVDPQAGTLLGMMAQPDATQVSTVMRELNTGTGGFDMTADATDVEPLKPQITNTIEVGYKGLIGDRLLLGVDVYYAHIQEFISPAVVFTPNVFMEPTSLGAYIASEAARLGLPLTAEQIAGLTQGMASVPLATVTPESPPDPDNPADIVLTFRNFGELDYWGADVGATLLVNNEWSFSGAYSFVSKNLFENVDSIADIALNAPRNKASLAAHYGNERLGLAAELRGRFVEAFPVNSGVFVGPVESYTLLDANVTYALPFSRATEVTLTGLNLLDDRHQEVPGAPYIGRMVLLRLRQSF
jgi:iron complex outermembrane receptor protein